MPKAKSKQKKEPGMVTKVRRNQKYHWAKLENVKDTFLLTDPLDRASVYTSLSYYNKKNNTAIEIITETTDNGVLVVRTK